jgi:hypothetical protein
VLAIVPWKPWKKSTSMSRKQMHWLHENGYSLALADGALKDMQVDPREFDCNFNRDTDRV